MNGPTVHVMNTKTGRYTYADLERIPEGHDRLRREILDGELFVTPAPSFFHQTVSMRLSMQLANHVKARGLGTLLAAPLDVKFDDENVCEPDLLFVANDRFPLLQPRFVDGPPTLAVEILSPSGRRLDLVRKRITYARFGVPNYWILDPEDQSLTALVLDASAYREAARATAPAEVSAPPFAEISINLAQLFSRAPEL